MADGAAGNAIESGVGFGLGEDPRCFPAPQRAFALRVGHVVRLTFLTRGRNGTLVPAYARYSGIVVGNFLSNTWRVHSQAGAEDALFGRRRASADAWRPMLSRSFGPM